MRHCPHHRSPEEFLQLDPREGTGALLGEQLGDDHLESFLLGSAEEVAGHPAEVVQDVSRLSFVPPAQELDFDSKLFERSAGLRDLNLQSTVSECKRHEVGEKDSHKHFS